MGERYHGSVDVETGSGALTDPPRPPVTQAQAQAFATQAQAVATQAQALAVQAQILLAPNDDVERAEKNCFAYQEITNLFDINKKYPILKLALEDWQHKEEYLSSRISHKEGRTAELTIQIYSILGIFVIFEGLVLTAVSQLTQKASIESGGVSLCRKIWFPIVLTGSATVVTIVGILYKFASLQSLEFAILADFQAKRELALRVNNLRRIGPQQFKFHLHTDNFANFKYKLAPDSKLVKKGLLVIISLVIFAAIFILSYFVMLCDI